MKALASMAARSCLLKHVGPKGAAKKRATSGLKGRTCHGTTAASGLFVTREDSGRRVLSLSVRSHAQTEEQEGKLAPCITLTDNALAHLNQLKEQKASTSGEGGEDLLLRIGIKQGGCSGMSYFMDFEAPDKVVDEDAVMELEGDMKLVCDPKSLLYLFGMELDYSNELIGGGFKFSNPNADSTCGCGKSFSV